MTKLSPRDARRIGREAFWSGADWDRKDPDVRKGWEQAKADWEEQQMHSMQDEINKLHAAKNADDLKNWLEEWVLPKVLEDRGF